MCHMAHRNVLTTTDLKSECLFDDFFQSANLTSIASTNVPFPADGDPADLDHCRSVHRCGSNAAGLAVLGASGQLRPGHLSTGAVELPPWALVRKHPVLSTVDQCHPCRRTAGGGLRATWSALHSDPPCLGSASVDDRRGRAAAGAGGPDQRSRTRSAQAGAGPTAATDRQLDWLWLLRGKCADRPSPGELHRSLPASCGGVQPDVGAGRTPTLADRCVSHLDPADP